MKKWTPLSVAVGVVFLAWPAVASACLLPTFFRPIMTPEKMDLMVGLSYAPEDPATTIFGADLGLKLGSKGGGRVAGAYCTYGSWSTPLFGANTGFEVWKNAAGKVAAEIQAGASWYSKDGESEIAVPVGVELTVKSSDKMSFFGGLHLAWFRFEYDPGAGLQKISGTDSDPVINGGVAFKAGTMDALISAGIKGSNDLALNFALRVPFGGK